MTRLLSILSLILATLALATLVLIAASFDRPLTAPGMTYVYHGNLFVNW